MASPARRASFIVLMCAPLVAPIAALAAGVDGTAAASWTFRVLLDGKPIGQHRFSLAAAEDSSERTLISEATFAVRWLGMTVYRYQHRAVERWRGGCLAALEADTDDNGQRTRVKAESSGDAFAVIAPVPQTVRGCVWPFAYWHPALRQQSRLLNAQTGRVEPVRIEAVGDGTVTVGERAVAAQGWRIDGPGQPIVVWYSAQGDWLALDTVVDGGRKLSYRRP
jgi:hypothetical protein